MEREDTTRKGVSKEELVNARDLWCYLVREPSRKWSTASAVSSETCNLMLIYWRRSAYCNRATGLRSDGESSTSFTTWKLEGIRMLLVVMISISSSHATLDFISIYVVLLWWFCHSRHLSSISSWFKIFQSIQDAGYLRIYIWYNHVQRNCSRQDRIIH